MLDVRELTSDARKAMSQSDEDDILSELIVEGDELQSGNRLLVSKVSECVHYLEGNDVCLHVVVMSQTHVLVNDET